MSKIKEIEKINKTLTETRKWAFSVSGEEYIEQMHYRKEEEDYGGYAIGKFKMMQHNFGDWYASLDDVHRFRLAMIIYNRINNNELTKWEEE